MPMLKIAKIRRGKEIPVMIPDTAPPTRPKTIPNTTPIMNPPIETKVCCTCKESKTLDNYGKDKRQKDGLNRRCKACRKIASDARKEQKREYDKARREANPEYNRRKCKEYYAANREKITERAGDWYRNNKERYNERVRKWQKEKMINDTQFMMKRRLRDRLRNSLRDYTKKGKCKTSDEYGINYQAIIEHLGPCPGPGYEIDHIYPLHLFDLENEDHIKAAFSPKNHRWLSARENKARNYSGEYDQLNINDLLESEEH